MAYDFDQRVDRRHSESAKWLRYDEEVLPLWLADMDFRSPDPVIRALHERVEHGCLATAGIRQNFAKSSWSGYSAFMVGKCRPRRWSSCPEL